MAAELFSYSRQQLIGIKLLDLFADTHKEKQETLMEQHVEASGAVVMVSGKVVRNICATLWAQFFPICTSCICLN